MGDLPTKKRTESTRLIGADPTTGDETNHAGVTANNDLLVSDRIDTAGVQTELTVGTTAVPLRIGASNLSTRKVVTALAKNNAIFWGYTSLVTTTTGTRIFKNQMVVWNIGPNIDIYFIADATGRTLSITEGA